MKAWEYCTSLYENAKLVLRDKEEQTWTDITKTEMSLDNMLRVYWRSNVPGSAAPESVITAAVQSMENRGYDVSEAENLLDEGFLALKNDDMKELNKVTGEIYKALYNAKKNKSSLYWMYTSPSSFQEYLETINMSEKSKVDTESDDFKDRTLAAWYGRLIGGALGTALEGYTPSTIKNRFNTITDYVREPNTYNDDITYELALLFTVEEKGRLPVADEIASSWLKYIPSGWSAEQIALENLRRGIYPPMSGRFNNPYSEWIGAQMRGAMPGQLSPGDPLRAAYLAWSDATISHDSNGILGEVFNALLTSLAFVKNDIREVLIEAINLISPQSEYRSVLEFALQKAKSCSFEEALELISRQFRVYNWIHSYPNAAAEVLSLWFGNGDFDKTMSYVAACGVDTDCNAAQLGVILGAFLGTKGINKRWYECFNDTIVTYLRGEKEFSIKDIANRTVKAAGIVLNNPTRLDI